MRTQVAYQKMTEFGSAFIKIVLKKERIFASN